jgi:hydrogenase maturation protein HypF
LKIRLRVVVRGAVQGVGFRPFIYRLATELGLTGWVNNSAQGVFIEVEGGRVELERFLLRIEAERPPRSFIQSLEATWFDPVGYAGFEIRASVAGGEKTALVLPDIATCPDCLREVFDPANRRYRYPFTNCTHCGPRFSIIEALPYDRASTSMKGFTMCVRCQSEYEDPANRRFHAQPNACPDCGPQVELWDRQGTVLAMGEGALDEAAKVIRVGRIVAVKGLGGFQLLVAARDEESVRRLRERKHREEKPLALMVGSMEAIRALCEVSPVEERLLRSPEAPVVLLRRNLNNPARLAGAVAPGNPNLGVMLPYTPLHHLLMTQVGEPVVATSGNLSDEPICTDERDALECLGGIADVFLVHNRPIVRHVDDSIVRVLMGRELVLRRARGFAPLPVLLRMPLAEATPGSDPVVLAVGAHLKNTIALKAGEQVFLSQHIGDLETDRAYEAFERVIADLERLYAVRPAVVAADAHPDYLSTQFARSLAGQGAAPAVSQAGLARSQDATVGQASGGRPRLITVQHHVAHVLSCMAENELEPPVLGVSWDGTGYGLDGTVWGGEFFLVTDTGWGRVAHLRPFRLPGGDRAVKEPRRTALGLLHELWGEAAFARTDLPPLGAFTVAELGQLRTMLERQLNSPLTSSAGRLFDAVAALIGLRQVTRFEGQSAMELEFALEGVRSDDAYEFAIEAQDARRSGPAGGQPSLGSPAALILDWAPVVQVLLADVARKLPVGEISARFHNGLADAIVAVAGRVGQRRVVLSGGCFQNRYLTERTIGRARAAGLQVYWHQRVPPNDGGICLGQVVAAVRQGRLAASA